jgi:hypothetical protein
LDHTGFGWLEIDRERLVLNELCAAYERPYFDLASDVLSGEYAFLEFQQKRQILEALLPLICVY